jgi:hypothetical protein
MDDNPLIHPCRCTGSVKYIHEECLKTWLVSRESSVDKGECELCKTAFEMKFTIVSVCSLGKAIREKSVVCVFVPLLFLVMAMLFGIMYVLIVFYLIEASSAEDQGYAAALIFICVVAAFVLCCLITVASKQSCLTNVLQDWQILSMDYDENDEASKLDDSSKDIRSPEDELIGQRPREERVLVVPRFIKFGRKEVLTPPLQPNLAAILAEGDKTVYIPPRIAQSLNISPVRSRLTSMQPILKHCTSTPTFSSNLVAPTLPYDQSTRRFEEA